MQGRGGTHLPVENSEEVPDDDSAIEAQLRQRYGSHMDVVKLGLDAWKAIGLLYAEWREPWTESTAEYAELRALAFLRCAVRLSKAMKACSAGKHKSWYAYLAVWVFAPRCAGAGGARLV